LTARPQSWNVTANYRLLHSKLETAKGNAVDHTQATVEQFMESDTVFAGTPDDVYDQIKAFHDRIGGFGHLLFFGQGGFLDHKDTMDNIRLFGSEVMPRLRELSPEKRGSASAAAE
jgi:alkanesulfonate monooxygenase SsuD/methylene tetrahydromethanopterin reductase-like flavin-dependent oxidoreductase (luciferase family)